MPAMCTALNVRYHSHDCGTSWTRYGQTCGHIPYISGQQLGCQCAGDFLSTVLGRPAQILVGMGGQECPRSGRLVHLHMDTERTHMWMAEGHSMTRCPHCQALSNPTWATCPICGQCLRAVTATPEPLTQYYPCLVCGKTERWNDQGIWRCRACWPPGSLQRKAAAPGPAEVSHA
jgi:hypothetical protein